jgi:hypothetical protein
LNGAVALVAFCCPTVLEASIKAGAARNAAPVVAFFIKSLLELFIKEGFKT